MKNVLVMKFGGATVSNPEKFLKVADIIIDRKKEYEHVVVVVSAMGNATDNLINLAKKVHPIPPKREHDMLISVGERISISLLAMALLKKGNSAVSFTGSQSGIITCNNHSEAKIINVRPFRLIKHLEKKDVVIVAGFQGVSSNGEITTLGRGGSDTSAVALGVALNAESVEFYKDVNGIYDKDPKKFKDAHLFENLTYDQMLKLTSNGDGVLHSRCVNLASLNNILLHVKNYRHPKKNGTIIGKKTFEKLENPVYELI